jgi:gp16 family phage-associated protein
MSKKPSPLEKFVDDLGKKNMTVAAWSRANNFDRHKVYAVLRGRIRGRSGESRLILERMGVKPPPVIKVRAAEAPQ